MSRRLFDHSSWRVTGKYQQLPLSTIIQSRLPQKQGLCQVVKTPDFEMLSAFYQAIT
jgi:hypothetical protein